MLSTIAKSLVTHLSKAPSADNSQPWHFTRNGQYLTITYDRERVAGTTFAPDDPATLLCVGGVIENLAQAENLLGLVVEPQVISGSDLKSGSYYKIKFEPKASPAPPEKADNNQRFQRHTNRFPFKNKKIPDDLIEWIDNEQERNSKARIIDDRDNIRRIADLVRSASEIRFQTPEVHEWLAKSLRFSKTEVKRGDGLDVRTLDLPPGGAMFLKFISEWRRMSFMNRFGAYKLLSKIDSAPVGKAPALVVISSPPENQQIIAAGRLLTRIWTRLNEEGIAVHPYYVIPDQLVRLQHDGIPKHLLKQAGDLEEKSNEVFGFETGSEQLRMLLRVGYPKKESIRSRRLPLETVFTDNSQ